MIKRYLSLLFLALCFVFLSPKADAAGVHGLPDFADYKLEAVAAAFYHPDVDVTVKFQECGVVNAYYWPSRHEVVICTELFQAVDPAVVRYALAHELAHAVIMQLDLPYTGSHEAAADELASYVLIKMGRPEDVLMAGLFWLEMSDRYDVPPEDDHPAHLQRYYTLFCLGLEGLGVTGADCRGDLARIVRNWDRLLGL